MLLYTATALLECATQLAANRSETSRGSLLYFLHDPLVAGVPITTFFPLNIVTHNTLDSRIFTYMRSSSPFSPESTTSTRPAAAAAHTAHQSEFNMVKYVLRTVR